MSGGIPLPKRKGRSLAQKTLNIIEASIAILEESSRRPSAAFAIAYSLAA